MPHSDAEIKEKIQRCVKQGHIDAEDFKGVSFFWPLHLVFVLSRSNKLYYRTQRRINWERRAFVLTPNSWLPRRRRLQRYVKFQDVQWLRLLIFNRAQMQTKLRLKRLASVVARRLPRKSMTSLSLRKLGSPRMSRQTRKSPRLRLRVKPRMQARQTPKGQLRLRQDDQEGRLPSKTTR
jgi:hypothetical protein